MPTWLLRLDRHFPIRYLVWLFCAVGLLLSALTWTMGATGALPTLAFAVLLATGVHDVRQTRHSVLRNYPVIGHLRFFFEFIRPEMRQYFIEGDNEAAPYSRQQRCSIRLRRRTQIRFAASCWLRGLMAPRLWRRMRR